VGWIYALLLACAVAVLLAAEWPRVSARVGLEGRRLPTPQRRRKPHLHLVQSESEEFAASVERDLEQLPTLDERDRR
jgi:predicted outer membrane lipoprotein